MLGTAACSNADSVTNVQDILSACHTSNEGLECINWDGKTITIRGYLDNGGYYEKPVLAHDPSIINEYDSETLEDIFAIEMLVSDVTQKKYEPYLGQNVLITGKLNTECVSRSIEADKKTAASLASGNDEITITMLTGTCHYVINPYMVDVTIRPDFKNSKLTADRNDK